MNRLRPLGGAELVECYIILIVSLNVSRATGPVMNQEVPTVEPRPRPPPVPTHLSKTLCRRMTGSNPTLSEAVVRNVMLKCTEVDKDAKLVSMTRDTLGHTHMRVRAGDVHSVSTLQRELSSMFPLSECNVSESWVDGTLEAELTVHTAPEEFRRARKMVTDQKLVAYWIGIGTISLFMGLGQWVAALSATLVAHDEL
jgi:hypothetical protein